MSDNDDNKREKLLHPPADQPPIRDIPMRTANPKGSPGFPYGSPARAPVAPTTPEPPRPLMGPPGNPKGNPMGRFDEVKIPVARIRDQPTERRRLFVGIGVLVMAAIVAVIGWLVRS